MPKKVISRYHPDFKTFQKKAKEANLIPVYREILADMETPVSAFKRVNRGRYAFLLESVEGGEKWARYSFIGSNPKLIFLSKGDTVEIRQGKSVRKVTSVQDPLPLLKEIMKDYRPAKVEGLPRFFGGAVGYVSYDMVRFFEVIPDRTRDDLNLKDCFFLITDTIIIFDNLSHTVKVVSNVHIKDRENLKEKYASAIKEIDSVISLLKKPLALNRSRARKRPVKITSNLKKNQFKGIVEKAKEYIRAGDIIQAVLSQRFTTKTQADPFDIYRALRLINPSPYMYYLKLDDLLVIGSSPEIQVRLEEKVIEVRPIAGTRPRGADPSEDESLKDELQHDPKELAEHIMLVDLGRNDVGRVARIGTVRVPELMIVEPYSHVMHLVSSVQGTIEDKRDCFDVFRVTFPAGTVSGAPKIRAMEIIEELEPLKRGPYAGAVGYFSFSGNMDFCITIRTMVMKGKTIYFQAGAGIVADSDPEREYWETVNKAKAMAKAIEMASAGLM
jgi:anthranilate synthase component 1